MPRATEFEKTEKGNILESLKFGQNLIEAKSYDAAEKILNFAISYLKKNESDPERYMLLSEVYNNLGLIYYKKVEFNKAQSFYTKSIEANKIFAPAYYNRGVIYYRLGVFESALKDLEIAVSLQPTNKEFQAGFKACEEQL